MHCLSCASRRQAELTAEINLHLRGREHLDHPSLLTFPEVVVCLDCGFSRFTIPGTELALLLEAAPNDETSVRDRPSATSRDPAQDSA